MEIRAWQVSTFYMTVWLCKPQAVRWIHPHTTIQMYINSICTLSVSVVNHKQCV